MLPEARRWGELPPRRVDELVEVGSELVGEIDDSCLPLWYKIQNALTLPERSKGYEVEPVPVWSSWLSSSLS